jgi:hypothetical protein
MDLLSSYHEAGHATVSYLLGEMPDLATIHVEGDSLGHTQLLGVEARAIAEAAVRGNGAGDRERVMRYLVGLAAGPAAQALKMRQGRRLFFYDEGQWDLFGGSKDYELAGRVMGASGGLFPDVRQHRRTQLTDIVDEAFDLLQQRSIWSAVGYVAEDLLRFGILDFEGIRDAIEFPDAIQRRGVR